MVAELDPAPRSAAPPLQEGGTIPIARRCRTSTSTRSSPSLDGDTREYLTLLLTGGAEGLRGKGRELSPTAAPLRADGARPARVNGALRQARGRTSGASMHNFSLLVDELGAKDDQIAEFVQSSNAVFAVARGAGRRTCARRCRSCPPTLSRRRRQALGKTDALATELGPTLQALLPGGARARAVAARDAPVPDADDADHPRPDPAVRARGAPGGERPAAGAARPRGGDARPHRARSRSSTRCSTSSAYNPPGDSERGLPVLASRGRTTSATDLRHAGRARPDPPRHRRRRPATSLGRARAASGSATTSCSACSMQPARDPPTPGVPADTQAPANAAAASAEAGARPSDASPSMAVLRAVVLRPAAVPVAGLRRRDPAQAEGLPLHRPRSRRRRSSRRRPTCASPACRSARSRTIEPDKRTGRSDGRRSSSSRATRRCPRDARAILRQKTLLGETYVELTPGTAHGPSRSRGRVACRRRRSRRRSSSTRSSAPSTPRTRAGFQVWMQAQAQAVDGRGAGPQRRARQPRAVRRGRERRCRHPQPPAGRGAAADPRHRRRVRRADRARRPAALA